MTAYAVDHAALNARVRRAWEAYRDSLADLAGRPYDDAEAASWERLQDALRDIEEQRGGED
jgi:hypothetical protein